MNQPPSEREQQDPSADYADVLEHFQQVMRRFLDTQEAVMRDILEAAPDRALVAQSNMLAIEAPAVRPAPVSPMPAVTTPLQTATTAPSLPVAAAPASESRAPEAPAPAVTLPPVAPPTPIATSEAFSTIGRDDITQLLLVQVSDRTGYPAESLSLDADLEADLGIDSIKRVEIVGEVLRALSGQLVDQPDIEVLTSMRSLGEVADQLLRFVAVEAVPAPVATTPEPVTTAAAPSKIGRYVVRCFPADMPSAFIDFALGSTIALIGDSGGVAAELERLLVDCGYVALKVRAAAAVADLKALPASGLAAIVYLESDENGRDAEKLFEIAKVTQKNLETAASSGSAAFVAVSRIDGAFGLDESTLADAAQGALAGLVKTIAHEWPGVRCKTVDLTDASPQILAQQIFAELRAADGLVEVGYRKDGTRTTLKLVPGVLPAVEGAPAGLTSESVVLVTGGARGITAEVCVALAGASRATLVLVGRTEAPPQVESADTAAADNERDVKRIIFDRFKTEGRPATPVQIESAFQQLVREREIRSTLRRVTEAGSHVTYLACDVRDETSFGALIDDVYTRFGRIDGVIHGAGLIEDRLVADKTVESFRRVYETKVASASVLEAHLRPETLSFLVHFSSVSARFGNQGQSDYAAANEVLNKQAQALDRTWPGRVVAINWGPWVGAGMVTAEAERHFAERGIGLIPLDVGSRMLLEELANGRKGDTEVVIGELTDDLSSFLETDAPQPRALEDVQPAAARVETVAASLPFLATRATTIVSGTSLEIERTLSLDHDLFLSDHVLDGNAVLPFTGAMELMIEAASLLCPHLEPVRLRDVRAFHGIVLDGRNATIKVRARLADADAGSVVSVEISPVGDGRAALNYRGFVDMAASPAPVTAPTLTPGQSPFGRSTRSLYADWLFHGPRFQAIEAIESLDESGVSAVLRGSSIIDCINDVDSTRWRADPILMDAAFQLVLVWARHFWDITLLPSSVAAFNLGPGIRDFEGPVRCEVRIRPESQSPICHNDLYLFRGDGRLLASIEDLQSAGSKALNRLAGNLAQQSASQ